MPRFDAEIDRTTPGGIAGTGLAGVESKAGLAKLVPLRRAPCSSPARPGCRPSIDGPLAHLPLQQDCGDRLAIAADRPN